MQAVAIGANRIGGDASAVFAFSAQPFPAKGFHLLGVFVGLMAMIARSLHLGSAIEDIRAGHHCFIVHVGGGLAVAVCAGDTLEQVVVRDGLIVKVQMTHYAQPVVLRHVEHLR